MPGNLNPNYQVPKSSWVVKPQLPPVIPDDQELMDWKTLDELVLSKIEAKKKKQFTCDLTWKDVLRIPSKCDLERGATIALLLEYDYFSYEKNIYRITGSNNDKPAFQIIFNLSDEDINEVL